MPQNCGNWRLVLSPDAGKYSISTSQSQQSHPTFLDWSIVMKDGIIDFLRVYLSCHSRSVFTVGSDATKNWKERGSETLKSDIYGEILANSNIKKQEF